MREISAHELLRSRHCSVDRCEEVDDVDPDTGLCPTHKHDQTPVLEKMLGIPVVLDRSVPPGMIAVRRRGRPPRERTTELTERELEVLRKASEGATTTQIAAALFLSKNTVTSHRKHLLVKLDAKTIAHAVAVAMRKGILT